MNIGQANGFCAETAGLFQFVGYGITILKIVIPVILIVLGVVGLGKAVIAAKDDEIKTQVNSLIKKFIVAVVIFFVPNLISGLFKAIDSFSDVEADYNVCVQCISKPNGNDCKKYIK